MIAIALALSVVAQDFTEVDFTGLGRHHEELEPTTSVFGGHHGDPYDVAIANALGSPDPYRRCQVVAVPSFEPEWCVFLQYEPDPQRWSDPSLSAEPPQIVRRRMEKHLYLEMSREMSMCQFSAEVMSVALSKLSVPVQERIGFVSRDTAETLDAVWSAMLQRTRHPETKVQGNDGVRYHVAHWQYGIGHRGAETWSPEESTRAGALIGLAERMARFAEAPSPQLERELLAAARDLLERIRLADEDERRR